MFLIAQELWKPCHPALAGPALAGSGCQQEYFLKETIFIKAATTGEYRFLMDGPRSWKEARQKCHNVGGFLVEFESVLEHRLITTVINLCR